MMTKYRQNLPQMGEKTFITDGGLETVMLFHQQIALPEFAAYDLLRTQQGIQLLDQYYKRYVALARQYEKGIVLETPTWRASQEWGNKIGDSPTVIKQFNIQAVALLEQIRDLLETEQSPIVVSGCIGPKGDGYTPAKTMSPEQAYAYHCEQIETFADTSVDMIGALTLNYIDEAIGISKAAQQYELPVCISFTVETDGRLPSGDTLETAIDAVDEATQNGPTYYMINCAHPTHFSHLFTSDSNCLLRVKGLRGNASCLSHAKLDESDELDEGNPEQFGRELSKLRTSSPHITVLGGCCGTDHRHIEEICRYLSS